MKNIIKKLPILVCVMLSLAMILSSCTRDPNVGGSGTGSIVKNVDSIEILGTEKVLMPGEYEFNALAKPEGSSQSVKFEVLGMPKGVGFLESPKENTLLIASNAENNAKIKIKATSNFDKSIFTIREYVLNIPEVKGQPITTEAELRAIDTNEETRKGSYILMNDIELTSPWDGIGTSEIEDDYGVLIRQAEPWNGVLDGNGYTISNIVMNHEGTDIDARVKGFIEQIGSAGELKNIRLVGSLNAHSWSGGVAGINGGTISNVRSEISVELLASAAGALVSDNRGVVQNSIALAPVSSGVSNSSARSAGLFVNSGSAVNCFGDKTIMGTPNVQTLVGAITNDEIMLTTSMMKTASTFSAFDEDIWHVVNGNYPTLKSPDFSGGEEIAFVSITNKDTQINLESYWDYQITAVGSGVVDPTVTFSLKQDMAGVEINPTTGLLTFDKTLVTDWSDVTVVASLKQEPTVTNEKTFKLLSGAKVDNFEISNENDLYRIITDPRLLSSDLTLSNDIVLNEYKEWPGIGGTTPFTGTFNGNGYTISGLNTSVSGAWGFFINVTGASKDTVVIQNLKLQGTIEGANSWGGTLVGSLNKGIVQNVITDVNLTTDDGLRVGAIVGVNSLETSANQSTIKNSIALGNIDKNASAGGIVAANNGYIQNCYFDMDLVGTKADTAFGGDKFGFTTDEMLTKSTFANLDESIYYLADGFYPCLINDEFVAPELDFIMSIPNPGLIDIYLTPTYQLTVETNPNQDNLNVVFELEGNPVGVELTEQGLLSFTEDCIKGLTFKVIATDTASQTTFRRVIYTTSTAPVKPVEISTEDDLRALASVDADLSKVYYLVNDIVLTKSWENMSIGTVAKPFTGFFDGNGYKISGFVSNNGLFGAVKGETADTVVIQNLAIEGKVNLFESARGGLVNNFDKGIIQNIIVDIDITQDSSVAGTAMFCGQVIGFPLADSTLKNAIILGEVGDFVGTGWMKSFGVPFGVSDGKYSDIYYDLQTTNAKASIANGSVIKNMPKTTLQLMTASTYNDTWNSDIWYIVDGSYPMLKNASFVAPVDPSYKFVVDSGVIDVYTSSSCQLQVSSFPVTTFGVVYTLKDVIDGVSITESGLLTFTEAFIASTEVTVICTADNGDVFTYVVQTTSSAPVAISTEDELRALASLDADLSRNYYLVNDIVLTKSWRGMSIGSVSNPFSGSFNGNGYKISGFTSSSGMFGYVKGKTADSVVIENLSIEGAVNFVATASGGLVDAFNLGIIQNLYVDIDITLDETAVGVGIFCGQVIGEPYKNATLKNTIIVGTVGNYIGASWMKNFGVPFAVNNGKYSDVYYDEETTNAKASIADGHVLANMPKTTLQLMTASTYNDTWNSDVWYIVDGSYPMLKNASFVAPENPNYKYIEDNGTIDVYVNKTHQLQAKSIPETEYNATFAIENVVDGVSITESGLLTFNEAYVIGTSFTVVCTAESGEVFSYVVTTTSSGPKAISTEDELRALASPTADLTRSYYLANDIVLTKSWEGMSIGTGSNKFTGLFDGNGYKISGFVSTSGLFGEVEGKTADTVVIQNLAIEGTVTFKSTSCGGLVNIFHVGIIQNIFVDIDIYQDQLSEGSAMPCGQVIGRPYKNATLKNAIIIGEVGSFLGSSWVASFGVPFAFNDGKFSDVYYDEEATNAKASIANGSVIANMPKTTLQLMTAGTYNASWDIDVWYIVDGTYPMLKNASFVAPENPNYKYVVDNGAIDVFTQTTYQLETSSFPVVDYTATFAMQDTVAGVTISDSGLLTFTKDFVVSTSFTVVCTSNSGEVFSYVVTTTSSGPQAISSEQELLALKQAGADLTRNYYLSADIVLTDVWSKPIGEFSGTFDGQGHTIEGVFKTGLFNKLKPKTADQICVENLELKGTFNATGDWTGGLVNYMLNAGVVQNCIFDLDLVYAGSGGIRVGVIVGQGTTTAKFKNIIILGAIGEYKVTKASFGIIVANTRADCLNVLFNKDDYVNLNNGKYYFSAYKHEIGSRDVKGFTMTELSVAGGEGTIYAKFSSDIWIFAEGQEPSLKELNDY